MTTKKRPSPPRPTVPKISLEQYIQANFDALQSNPPMCWPSYQTDPVAAWRYFFRCFGAGLADWSPAEVEREFFAKIAGTIYSSWFMRLEFSHSKRPDIDAKTIRQWVTSAMEEARNGR